MSKTQHSIRFARILSQLHEWLKCALISRNLWWKFVPTLFPLRAGRDASVRALANQYLLYTMYMKTWTFCGDANCGYVVVRTKYERSKYKLSANYWSPAACRWDDKLYHGQVTHTFLDTHNKRWRWKLWVRCWCPRSGCFGRCIFAQFKHIVCGRCCKSVCVRPNFPIGCRRWAFEQWHLALLGRRPFLFLTPLNTTEEEAEEKRCVWYCTN